MSDAWPAITMPDFGEDPTPPPTPPTPPPPPPEPEPGPRLTPGAATPTSFPAPCPECQQICLSPGGMGRHRATAHGVVDIVDKVKCTEPGCSSWTLPYSMGRHQRNVHGIYGGVTGIVRRKQKQKQKKLGRPVGSKNGVRKPPVLRDAEIEMPDKLSPPLLPLSAEQITRAAAEALWPKGIPHDKLSALLRWNNQTHDFFSEVNL